MEIENFTKNLKVTIVGDSFVGKTNILLRYFKNKFCENYMSTIGVDFLSKNIIFEDNEYILQVWDTAGQERFHGITNSFYKGSLAIILVYDITNLNSFNNLKKIKNDIDKYADDETWIILVGNKTDLEDQRQITFEEAKQFSIKNSFYFFETSCKDNYQIDNLFDFLIKQLFKEKNYLKMTKNINSSNNTISRKLINNKYEEEKNNCKC